VHALQNLYLVTTGKKLRAFYLKNKAPFRLYLSLRRLFFIRDSSHFPYMQYKSRKLGCDRSITEVNLLGEKSTFSSACLESSICA